jgi:hypothetical protein
LILRQRYKKKTIKGLLLAGEGEREFFPPKRASLKRKNRK